MDTNSEIKQVIHELAVVVGNIQDKTDENRLRKAIDILENHVDEKKNEVEYFQPEV